MISKVADFFGQDHAIKKMAVVLAQLPDLQSDFTPELACVAAQVFDFA
jgi:hypothetical protein